MLQVSQAQNAGLWLDKYLVTASGNQPNDDKPKSILVGEVARIPEPPVYKAFYERWKASLAETGVRETHMREATVSGRLVVGLGNESVLETSISLHRTYGVPFIPGSALKGLASRYADRRLEGKGWRKRDGEDHTILFGSTETAGYVTFFDALYVPGSGHEGKALWPDVITVHHPNYYQGDAPPADWDSPNPVSFLSATGNYLIALRGDDAWVNAAFDILALALAEEGIGAKTSSGYGRMSIRVNSEMNGTAPSPMEDKTQFAAPPEQAALERFSQRLERMPNAKVAGEIHSVFLDWQALDVDEQTKRSIAQAILDKIESSGRAKRSAGKAWYQELQKYIEAA